MTNFNVAVTVFALLLSLPQAFAASDSGACDHTIVFLPQSHRNVISPDTVKDETDEVARSQFQIASFIQRNAKLSVFSEQVDENLTGADITGDLQTYAHKLKQMFPSGVPSSFDKLSPEQSHQLSYAGADAVMLLTGKVPALYRVVPNRATQDALFGRIQELLKSLKPSEKIYSGSELWRLLNDTRERLALSEIKEFFAANPDQRSVILVFGRLHNFRRHDDIFPSRCIAVPEEFANASIENSRG